MYDFKALYEAENIEEVIRLRQKYPEARIIAGGSDVLIRIRDGKYSDAELISINGIDALRGVSLEKNGTIRIGALTSFSHLAADPVIQENIPVLGEAANQVGSPQIRNIGTIGGNVCNGSPAADTPPTLFALDAEVELAGAEGIRRLPIRDFYIRAGVVALKPDELLTAVLIPEEAYRDYTGHYIKYAMRNALDISVVSCSVNVRLTKDKKRIDNIRAAFGAVGPVPLRTPDAEASARGQELTEQTLKKFSLAVLKEIQPWSDWRTSKEFREHIAGELSARALIRSIELGGGKIHE